MLGDFVRGFQFAWSGLGALRTPGLGRYVALPVIVSVGTFGAVIVYALQGFDRLLEWLTSWLPSWLAWLEWLLWPLFLIVMLLLVVYAFTLVANLVGAPFNGMLAEKYETRLGAGGPAPLAGGVLRGMLESLMHELRKLWYLVRWLVLAGVLFVIPGLNLLAPGVWLILGGWLLALEYLAYPMDNHRIGPAIQRDLLKQRRMLTLGFGAGVMLMTSVPVLNLLAMPAGVLGATRLWAAELRAAAPSGPGDSGDG